MCATPRLTQARPHPSPLGSRLRTLAGLAALALLSACSGGQQISATDEAARYAAHARGNYAPPGPPSDPWGPYIVEASNRFDVPERWVRQVMKVESGGKLYRNGSLVTSGAGAMGLMQVMPGTYDELRARHDLGDDPFDPHENIMAGTAYLREMYDIYGAPGFLAAYNAGPRRLDDYLSNNRPLPDETRKYVAMIGPYLTDSVPRNRSPAEQYAMNALPTSIPAGPRYGRGSAQPVAMAFASNTRTSNSFSGSGRAPSAGTIQVAQLPEPPAPVSMPYEPQVAVLLPAKSSRGFGLIPSAQAAEPVILRGGAKSGHWAIQVGAFSNESQAQAAAGLARGQAHDSLSGAHSLVAGVKQAKGTLYRARLVGLSRDSAVQACEKLGRSRMNCIVLSPDAQA
jgi:cell division protein FtsN